MKKKCVILVAAISAKALSLFAANVALQKPVIDYSNQYSGLPGYEASNVTDGSTSDVSGSNYWVTDNFAGIGAYFTLDLQGVFHVAEIDLRNTHNASNNDRGTGDFHILASTAVDASNHLISPITILTGTLSDVSGENPIIADEFTASQGLVVGDYRYVEFVVDSLAPYVNAGGAGLNEIEVQTTVVAVPEPSSMMLVVTATGALLCFRKVSQRLRLAAIKAV